MTDRIEENSFQLEDCEPPATTEEAEDLCKSNSESIDELVATTKSSCWRLPARHSNRRS